MSNFLFGVIVTLISVSLVSYFAYIFYLYANPVNKKEREEDDHVVDVDAIAAAMVVLCDGCFDNTNDCSYDSSDCGSCSD